MFCMLQLTLYTGFSSEIGTKLRESAVGQAGGSYYSRAALSSNDSKTLYIPSLKIMQALAMGYNDDENTNFTISGTLFL